MEDIKHILNDNEQIIWEDKPAFWPFVFNSGSLFALIFGSFWTLITLGFFWNIWDVYYTGDGKFPTQLLLFPHIYIGPLIMFVGSVYRLLVHRFMHYVITNRRIIIKQGLIGRDFNSIDYDQVTNLSVNVDLFDKLFNQNTGSILIHTPTSFRQTKNGAVPAPYELDSIHNPYDIFKRLKQATLDVRSDISYPNAFRPENNPGYSTNLSNNPFIGSTDTPK